MDWDSEALPPADEPVGECEKDDEAHDRTTVVHRCRGDRDGRWEREENGDEDGIDYGKDVDRQAPASKAERSVGDVVAPKFGHDEKDHGKDV